MAALDSINAIWTHFLQLPNARFQEVEKLNEHL